MKTLAGKLLEKLSTLNEAEGIPAEVQNMIDEIIKIREEVYEISQKGFNPNSSTRMNPKKWEAVAAKNRKMIPYWEKIYNLCLELFDYAEKSDNKEEIMSYYQDIDDQYGIKLVFSKGTGKWTADQLIRMGRESVKKRQEWNREKLQDKSYGKKNYVYDSEPSDTYTPGEFWNKFYEEIIYDDDYSDEDKLVLKKLFSKYRDRSIMLLKKLVKNRLQLNDESLELLAGDPQDMMDFYSKYNGGKEFLALCDKMLREANIW